MNYCYFCWSQTFFFLVAPKGAFCFSGCPVYRGLWGVRSSGIISSLLLFRLSVQMKGLVIVYVEIEPFAALNIRIADNEIYLSGSFFCFLRC